MKLTTTTTTIVGLVLSATAAAAPIVARVYTGSALQSDLATLAITSAYLQIYTANGAASMDEDAYASRWASLDEAASSIAASLDGAAAPSGGDASAAIGAFQTVREWSGGA